MRRPHRGVRRHVSALGQGEQEGGGSVSSELFLGIFLGAAPGFLMGFLAYEPLRSHVRKMIEQALDEERDR